MVYPDGTRNTKGKFWLYIVGILIIIILMYFLLYRGREISSDKVEPDTTTLSPTNKLN